MFEKMERIPAASYVQLYKDAGKDYLLLLTSTLLLLVVELSSLTLVKALDLQELVHAYNQAFSSSSKLRKYDTLFNFAQFEPASQLLAVSFFKSGSTLILFDIAKEEIFYALPQQQLNRGAPWQHQQANIPLCSRFSSSGDTFIVAYSHDNLVVAYDLNNKCLHPWSQRHSSEQFGKEFRTRYNRIVGIVELTGTASESGTKFLLYTHYTWFLLDISADLPDSETLELESKTMQVSKKPNRSDPLDTSRAAWFTHLKASQDKYLKTMLHGSNALIESRKAGHGTVSMADGESFMGNKL